MTCDNVLCTRNKKWIKWKWKHQYVSITRGMKSLFGVYFIVTPTLGSRPRLAKAWAKKEAQESHFMLPRVQESVKEWTLTFPSELPLWELKSRWTPEFSRSNFRGQNPFNWKLLYIIENILKHRCLKWVRMTHLDT